MKFCQSHWDMLRAAIVERGMIGLVATSGDQAAAQLAEQVTSGVAKSNFDPLMAAHNAIVSRVLDHVGIALLTPNEDGSHKCPLCFAQSCHDADCKEPGCTYRIDAAWIPGCADAMRDEARRLGLMGES